MQGKPEAWATAMVHMFLTKLRKALSKLIERHILRSYGAKSGRVRKDWTAWDNFIDSPVQLPSRKTSIKKLIQREILNDVERGGREFDREKMRHRRSALLFGPPGTSKTSLVRAIAKKIGWPLVELNPSHFLKRGLEHVYSESESIFNDLNDLSWTVVFFDEMDALAQKRGERIDVTRQLLTTSMLPKLSKLHDEGRVLFFMATNHQRNFDPAIKRPGRFDLLICMAPPSWSEKLKNIEKFWIGDRDDDDVEFVKDQLRTWISSDKQLVKILDLFTFDDFKSFLEHISKPETLRTAIENISQDEFSRRVKEWGDTYITLNAQEEKPATDISLKKEFVEDVQASRVQ